MSDMKNEITAHLKKAIKNLFEEEFEPKLTHPESAFGDYSTNAAMILFAKNKAKFKSPLDLASKLKETLESFNLQNIEKIEVVKPGFINFWISKEYLANQLNVKTNKTPLRSPSFAGQRIMVEFTDPNPFKEFHIGHLYSNTVGESISRLLEANGAELRRTNYQGDVGMHVAKAVYGMKNEELIFNNLEKKNIKEKIKVLGQCYAFGAKAYEEDEDKKSEIEKLNKKIYDRDPSVMGLYEKGREWSLEYFESIYKRLGTKFDLYYFESEVGKDGLTLVKEYLKKGIFEESQGAVIFPGEKYGLHNRVFINSLGLPTYEAKELGLSGRKYKDFNYDKSIIITGNEIVGYFKVLLKALEKIHPDLAKKTIHLPHGMVRLPEGKMSSRSGNVLTGEWLLDEAKRLLKENFKEMTDETSEQVAVGAVKYALLKSGIGNDIEFDFKESINLHGNSGPYLQYTYARTQSVINKLKINSEELKIETKMENGKWKMESEEISLLRSINIFPEIVEDAADKFAPNLLCNYLFDLAQKFNLFYQKQKIIGSENQNFRLLLTKATGEMIKEGLYLLGIQSPEKM